MQVQRPEPHGADLKGEPEDGAGAGLDRRRGERHPTRHRRAGQIRFEDGPVLAVGVDARALTQRELQILDQRAHRVGCDDRPPGRIPDISINPAPVAPVTAAHTCPSRSVSRSVPPDG